MDINVSKILSTWYPPKSQKSSQMLPKDSHMDSCGPPQTLPRLLWVGWSIFSSFLVAFGTLLGPSRAHFWDTFYMKNAYQNSVRFLSDLWRFFSSILRGPTLSWVWYLSIGTHVPQISSKCVLPTIFIGFCSQNAPKMEPRSCKKRHLKLFDFFVEFRARVAEVSL